MLVVISFEAALDSNLVLTKVVLEKKKGVSSLHIDYDSFQH